MKLNEIQQQLKVPKGNTNTFGGYKYRNCEDILEAVKPLLGDSLLTLTDEIIQMGDRFYVKATANFYEARPAPKAAETVAELKAEMSYITSVTAYARESLDKKGMDAAQITGAASSYARKYALNGLFLIDDTKDADSEEGEASKPSQSPQKAATAPAKARTFPLAKDPKIALEAAKQRVATLLTALHFAPTGTTKAAIRKEYIDAVMEHTGLDLENNNIDTIGDMLAAKVKQLNVKS